MTETQFAAEGLASTARWTAAIRAQESNRDDRLFSDPWAEHLAGDVGRAWLQGRSASSVAPIVLRTRFFDDFLQQVVRQEGLRQVVLVAAGLDTRAYRLSWPADTRLYALDQPEVLAGAQHVMSAAGARPACALEAIGVDLTQPWRDPLQAAGFDPDRASVWLIEGLLFYLPTDRLIQLLTDVTALAVAGSRLGFDVVTAAVLTSPLTRPWVDMQAAAGAPWIGTLDDPKAYLAGLGWSADLAQVGEPGVNFGRWQLPVIPQARADLPHHWLVTARRG